MLVVHPQGSKGQLTIGICRGDKTAPWKGSKPHSADYGTEVERLSPPPVGQKLNSRVKNFRLLLPLSTVPSEA